VLGPEPVLGGSAYIAAVIAEPGVIRHTGTMAKIVFAEVDGRPSERTAALLAACERAGFEAAISQDIQKTLWEKFALLAPMAGVTSVARRNFGAVRGDPARRAQLQSAVAEVVAVGQARGVALADDLPQRILRTVDGLPAEMRTSMEQDLERGNRLELPWLSGAVVRLGAAAGVPTPTHAAIVEALQPYAEGRA
jgi:2-dehydropantoate 2-reductase